uniref:Fibronectin type-III domain-containing protein n=1 Tax=Amphimedon queenslandica TaxID=400682 RepID=A0A1X7U6G2_AMPQE
MKKSIMIDLIFWLFLVLESFHYAWSCEITIEPNGTRSFLLGDYFNFICYANDNCSYFKMSVYENGKEGGNFSETWCSSYQPNFSNCSGYMSIKENFLDLKCVGYKSDQNHTRVYSTTLLLQVQETLASVTGNLVVRLGDNSTLNISWSPVFAYQGLGVYYDITFNETVHTTSDTNIVLPTLEMDECQFASIFIKPFIKTTDQALNGTTKQWNISIATPPMIGNSNYTLMMRKNKSVVIDVLVKFNLTDCDCPGRTNGVVLILKNDTFSYFSAAPLILNTADTCYGVTTLKLPPCISFESKIILKNEVGSNDGKEMFIVIVVLVIIFCCYKCYYRNRIFRYQLRNEEEPNQIGLTEIQPSTQTAGIGTQIQPSIQTAEIGTQIQPSIQTAEIGTQIQPSIQTAEIGTQIQPSIQTAEIGTQIQPSIQKSDLKQDDAMEYKQAQAPVSEKGKHTLSTTGEVTTYETNIDSLSDPSLLAVKSILLDHNIEDEFEEDTVYLTEAKTVVVLIDSSHANKYSEADISSDDVSTQVITGLDSKTSYNSNNKKEDEP